MSASFTANLRDFADALSALSEVVDGKSKNKLHQSVRIASVSDGAELTVLNGYEQSRIRVVTKNDGDYDFYIPHDSIHGILSRLSSSIQDVDFRITDKTVKVSAKNTKNQIKTLMFDQDPGIRFKADDVLASMRVDTSDFVNALERAVGYCNQRDIRLYMTGVLARINEQGMTVVACSGHRLFEAKIPCDDGCSGERDAIISVRGVNSLVKMFAKSGLEQFDIELTERMTRVTGEKREFICRNIDTAYANYREYFPEKTSKPLRVLREELAQATARAVHLARTHNDITLVEVESNGSAVFLRAWGRDYQCSDQIEIGEGPAASMQLNGTYLADALKSYNSEFVELRFASLGNGQIVFVRGETPVNRSLHMISHAIIPYGRPHDI